MYRDIDSSTCNGTNSKASNFQSKQYFVKNKKSGLYQSFNPFTAQLEQQGHYRNGEPVGLWKVIDQDGDEQHFQYLTQRVGALCGDGSRSSATGRGACSWHGGVAQWLYQSIKHKTGGTGKYQSLQSKTARAKKLIKQKYKLNQTGEQLEYQLTLLLLQLDDKSEKLERQTEKLKAQNGKIKDELKQTKQELEQSKQFKKDTGKKQHVKKQNEKDVQKQQQKQEQEFKSILHVNKQSSDSQNQQIQPSELSIHTGSQSESQQSQSEQDQEYVPQSKVQVVKKTYDLRSKKQELKQQPEMIKFSKDQNIKKVQKRKNESSQSSQNQCDISMAVQKQLQKQLSKFK